MSTPITIAAVPKAFEGHIGTIQRNALGSWRRLPDVAGILLLGDDDGLAAAAAEFGATHVPDVNVDEEGAPELDAVFHAIDRTATADWICYVNADILLLPDFWTAAQQAIATLGPSLSVARRWNLEVPDALAFEDGWADRLRRAARTEGELFTPFALDVFVHPRGMFANVPPFSVGAFSWDNWLLHEARVRGLPVADLTAADGVVHQNHGYRQFATAADYRRSPRALRNYWLAGDSLHGLSSAADATHVLRDGAIVAADTKSVSVIVADTGSATRLSACLAAFEHQSYPRTYIEVIVATEHGRLRPNAVLADFPFATAVRAATPGRAAARNKGAAVARGDLLAHLDADVLPAGDWVEQAVTTLSSQDTDCIVASIPQVRLPDRGSPSVGYYGALSSHRTDPAAPPTGVGEGVLLGRATWRALGPFDQLSPTGIAEYAWLARAAARGHPVVRAPAVVRRTVDSSWEQLTATVRQQVRAEMARSQLAPVDAMRTRGERWGEYTRRLVSETSGALRDADVPARARWGVRAAATWAWLVRLDESLPDRRLPTSVRRRLDPSGKPS
ncbi:Glycosyltransferase like family 2 [Geodermatophilus amargosae]|uniref:4,4'-diaponeurosporenoate glycosyltransferase n=1 Tax=Geodermatophilus amargosae TaxID=1296565 RepID=A0A1I7CW36_9ACTN|nr:glycosyltransferase family 2 protein [Geodermatophilus amargosae]SFU03633.1 Glycosyltransferase like family 2 [Geodermatophilus amargosae]